MTDSGVRRFSYRILLELFVLSNIAFLIVDILVAHAVNDFAHPAEWIPFGFGIVGSLLLAVGLVVSLRAGRAQTKFAVAGHTSTPAERRHAGKTAWHPTHRLIGDVTGWTGVAVGVSGLVWHIEGQFFEEATLEHLVYSAPFAAPLAFAGLGMLLLMNRRVPDPNPAWASWVVIFALGGFVGNFLLSLADHAQNGFFYAAEWIPVASSALTIGFLFTALTIRPTQSFVRFGFGILLLQALVGVAGFVLHVVPSFAEPGVAFSYRVIFGAPVFAPLLFADISILAALGLAAMTRTSGGSQNA